MLIYRKRTIVVAIGVLLTTFLGLAGVVHYGDFRIAVGSRSFTRDVYIDDEFNYTKIVYEVDQKGSPLVNTLLGEKEKRATLPLVLILSSIAGSSAYGSKRHFDDLYDTIASIILPEYTISLAFLVRSEREFNRVDDTIRNRLLETPAVAKVTLLQSSMLEEDSTISQKSRHADKVQRRRRRNIAKSRNFLLSNSLDVNQYSLFLDSDIENVGEAKQFLPTLISSKLDIIVPRIIKGEDQDYDKNSWRGERTKPSETQFELMDNNQWDEARYVPKDGENMYHFTNYLESEDEYNLQKDNPAYLVELDSVGGGVLFAKSVIYKQGAMFPTSYIVGTSWDRSEGYDGIETEGLCYMAKPLGYKCWGMPNLVAYHADR